MQKPLDQALLKRWEPRFFMDTFFVKREAALEKGEKKPYTFK